MASATGQAPEAFNEAVLAHFGTIPARQVLGPGEGGTTASGEYRPYPVAFRETVLPEIFRDTVLPGLAGQAHDEALEILGRLEP